MTKQSPNYLGVTDEQAAYSKAKVVVAPYPFEKTTSYAKGTEKGPAAILEASTQVEFFDCELQAEPWKVGIHTAKPLSFDKLSSKESLQAIEQSFGKFLDDKKFPIGLGGEHTISGATIAATAKRFPNLSVLQIDAHADLRAEYEGSPYSHACAMRLAHPHVKKLVEVGIRSGEVNEIAYAKEHDNIEIIYDHERKGSDWISRAINALPTNDVFLTIDVDGFTPSLIPATGTPEPGGLEWYEGLELIRTLFAKKNVVACDVVELMPSSHHHASSFTVAKLVYKLIGYWKQSLKKS
ncbi:MAG: agmatinase [Deltaproteobacteria bacterium]|nr:agmatinase [Deltaproteobacteria bacterium]